MNQEARYLEQKGLLVRRRRNDGFIGNYPCAPDGDVVSIPEEPRRLRTTEGLSEDIAQFRGLWERLPKLAKQRTQIAALFATSQGAVTEDSIG